MLKDWHAFPFHASVPWPQTQDNNLDWVYGVHTIESWLNQHVGHRWKNWAWDDSGRHNKIGVAFRWDQDRLLFVMIWS